MDNREELYDKMINIIKDADITDLGVIGKRCSDVAIQYTIDVLRSVAGCSSLIEYNTELDAKISELQSLLKPKP